MTKIKLTRLLKSCKSILIVAGLIFLISGCTPLPIEEKMIIDLVTNPINGTEYKCMIQYGWDSYHVQQCVTQGTNTECTALFCNNCCENNQFNKEGLL